MSARRTVPLPLLALFTTGYLAPYLLPTIVGRLDAGLPLSATQAGAVGSALLLSSAAAGFVSVPRIARAGARTMARAGLLLAVAGYGTAALTHVVVLVVAGVMLGGFGSGTATAVAATGIATQEDPQRASTLGLLGVSALSGALYLVIPRLGAGHGRPLAAMALTALAVWPLTARLPGPAATAQPATRGGGLPGLRPGLTLAGTLMCWALAQNSLWGVSGRIGLAQAHLGETAVGVVFAVSLGAGLFGVLGASALGPRLGRAVPIGGGTVLIAACIVLTASSGGPVSFAAGEIAWNLLYPVVLSYILGLAASLDTWGRWAVLVGSASSLGTAAGPLTGSVLASRAGFPVMGAILATALLAMAPAMTWVAVRTDRGPRPSRTAATNAGAPQTRGTAASRPTGAGAPRATGTGAPRSTGAGAPRATGAAATRARGAAVARTTRANASPATGAGAEVPRTTGADVTRPREAAVPRATGASTSQATGADVTRAGGAGVPRPRGASAPRPTGAGAPRAGGAGGAQATGGVVPQPRGYAATSARYRSRSASSSSRNAARNEFRASSRRPSAPMPSAERTASKLSWT